MTPTSSITSGSETIEAVAQPMPTPSAAAGIRIARLRRENSRRYA